MARKTNLEGLIHCEACGEDYSATYRRCPFCGEPPQGSRSSRSARDVRVDNDLDDEDDGYVFDGQDAFDEVPEPVRPVRSKGGKRLETNSNRRASTSRRSTASRGSGSSRPPVSDDSDDPRPPAPPINWPRLITFLCGLVIIAAALVIVFTVIYPQLHQDPTGDNSASVNSENPNHSVNPGFETELTSLALDTDSVTLMANGTQQLVLSFEPADWAGAPVWVSSDESLVTVDSTGLLTNVNATGSTQRVTVTVTAGGLTAQCEVYCRSGSSTEPPVTSDPPVISTPSGGETLNTPGTIINADSGLRVRSGPGTSYEILASVFNGTPITAVAEAANGWYEITFSGPGGAATTGYIMGEYIAFN